MNKYAEIAIKAVEKIMNENINPKDAWKKICYGSVSI